MTDKEFANDNFPKITLKRQIKQDYIQHNLEDLK